MLELRGQAAVTLIGAGQEFLLWAVLVALVGFGFWAEQKTKFGKKLTALVVTMTLAMILSNIRVIPTASPVYDVIFEQLLPIAIAMMLFRADIRRLVAEGGRFLSLLGWGPWVRYWAYSWPWRSSPLVTSQRKWPAMPSAPLSVSGFGSCCHN